MGSGYGSQHSMDPAGIFATSPGWRIAAPSTAADYVGLMNTALTLDDPVLVLEHVDLYPRSEQVPAGDLDYHLPLARAAVRGKAQSSRSSPTSPSCGTPRRRSSRAAWTPT